MAIIQDWPYKENKYSFLALGRDSIMDPRSKSGLIWMWDAGSHSVFPKLRPGRTALSDKGSGVPLFKDRVDLLETANHDSPSAERHTHA